MNDKIVVLDRVRENLRANRRGTFWDLVNQSINQTLSRTMLTAGLTLLASLALYFLGGKVLNGIAFALCTGIVVGTYSSIFVTSALLVLWYEYAEKKRSPLVSSVARSASRVSSESITIPAQEAGRRQKRVEVKRGKQIGA